MIENIIGVICMAILAVILAFFALWGFMEIAFLSAPQYVVESDLVSFDYQPSTEKARVMPIYGSNGEMSMAVHTSGNPENHVTVWNCGHFGRLTCSKRKVFQYAKPKSMLVIRSNSYDTRIIDIYP